jgi:hypothetical protein
MLLYPSVRPLPFSYSYLFLGRHKLEQLIEGLPRHQELVQRHHRLAHFARGHIERPKHNHCMHQHTDRQTDRQTESVCECAWENAVKAAISYVLQFWARRGSTSASSLGRLSRAAAAPAPSPRTNRQTDRERETQREHMDQGIFINTHTHTHCGSPVH